MYQGFQRKTESSTGARANGGGRKSPAIVSNGNAPGTHTNGFFPINFSKTNGIALHENLLEAVNAVNELDNNSQRLVDTYNQISGAEGTTLSSLRLLAHNWNESPETVNNAHVLRVALRQLKRDGFNPGSEEMSAALKNFEAAANSLTLSEKLKMAEMHPAFGNVFEFFSEETTPEKVDITYLRWLAEHPEECDPRDVQALHNSLDFINALPTDGRLIEMKRETEGLTFAAHG